ncbi:MAG: hydroxyethylthiazole kinase [Syntrophaceae bacterium]
MPDFDLKQLLEKIRKEKPLVHNITNYVVMNFTANTLLAMGASPVMAHAPEEVEEMAGMARSLVINIGTLSSPWIDSMVLAGLKANSLGVPVIFDPVGSGATSLRTRTSRMMVDRMKISVVRGNASEVLSLASEGAVTRGVDSAHSVEDAAQAAREIAGQINSVVAITGAVDLITDGERVIRCRNGHALMGCITGTGCAATATIAAFSAVTKDCMEAAAAGLAFFGLAGEIAAERAKAPGSFAAALVDALFEISPEEFQARALLD